MDSWGIFWRKPWKTLEKLLEEIFILSLDEATHNNSWKKSEGNPAQTIIFALDQFFKGKLKKTEKIYFLKESSKECLAELENPLPVFLEEFLEKNVKK